MQKRMVILQPNDATRTSYYKDVKRQPTLKQLQKLVDGYIEVITLNYDGKECQAVINEEGLLLNLPINVAATMGYYSKHGVQPYPIVGTVVVFLGFELS